MKETPPEIHVLNHKVRLLQAADGFRTSLDSIMLAAACKAGAESRVLDMGTGVGGAAFCLLWRVPECHVTGVDIQQSHVDLARANIDLNGVQDRAAFVCADIRDFEVQEPFDHIICNPPYLEAGTYTPSASSERAIALGHSFENMTLEDWVKAGFRNLKSGGSFTIIHRADHTDKIIRALGRKFGAVEIIPLYSKAGQTANRVIIRAIKDRKTPATLHPVLVLHDENGVYTKAADAILRDGAAIG